MRDIAAERTEPVPDGGILDTPGRHLEAKIVVEDSRFVFLEPEGGHGQARGSTHVLPRSTS
ncbi:MAG: hypothetical protein QFF03_01920 [Pseudomonadota bacterium]|nr:hypothetical protein [Pseudomonadota bacterium]